MKYREQIAKEAKAAIAAAGIQSSQSNSAPYHIQASAEQEASLILAQMATGSAEAANSQLFNHSAQHFQQSMSGINSSNVSAEQRAMLLKLHSQLGDILAGPSTATATASADVPPLVPTSAGPTPAVDTPSASTSATNAPSSRLPKSSVLKPSAAGISKPKSKAKPKPKPRANAKPKAKRSAYQEMSDLTDDSDLDSIHSGSTIPKYPSHRPSTPSAAIAHPTLISSAGEVSDVRSESGLNDTRGIATDDGTPRSSSAPGSPRMARRATRTSSKLRR